ncbi:MAG TPA: hypothetical protein VNN09_15350 [Candidatus Competibacteraceae bacterium]|nr:hypothetical protein [Candidatus Competibacteraceae bacterium]
MDFKDYLKILAFKDGSDLYLSTGAQPRVKFNGVLKLLEKEPLPSGRVKEIAYSIMSPAQIREFEEKLEMNLAVFEPRIGRFRVNVFRQRNEIAGLKEVMEKSENLGMQTMDSVLFELYRDGRISLDEAIRNADSPNNLRLKISLMESGKKSEASLDLSLMEEKPAEPAEEKKETPAGKPQIAPGGINLTLQ